jgi:hypothetical protein
LVKFGLKLDELETVPVGGGWGAGSSETKANLTQLGLELELSLAIEKISNKLRYEQSECDFCF